MLVRPAVRVYVRLKTLFGIKCFKSAYFKFTYVYLLRSLFNSEHSSISWEKGIHLLGLRYSKLGPKFAYCLLVKSRSKATFILVSRLVTFSDSIVDALE